MGAKELTEIKSEIKATIEGVRAGDLDRGTAAVMGQLYNVLLRAVEVERRVREVDELAAELETLRGVLNGRGRTA
jgi:hypothetical protein